VPWYSVAGSIDALHADRAAFTLACYLRDGDQVFETYWTTGRGVEPMAPTYGLLDMTTLGRREAWENRPAGLPEPADHSFRVEGRPTAQWPRLAAGHSDDLTRAANG
jgi:predicted dithiol-disulfide oxidoreductase (DUF899 family)